MHAAVTLFLLICSPPGSSRECAVGRDVLSRQQGQDSHWYAREQMLHLSALFPQPHTERASREGKKQVGVVEILLTL